MPLKGHPIEGKVVQRQQLSITEYNANSRGSRLREVIRCELDRHGVHTDRSAVTVDKIDLHHGGFGEANVEVWNNKLVFSKKIDTKDFIEGEEGLKKYMKRYNEMVKTGGLCPRLATFLGMCITHNPDKIHFFTPLAPLGTLHDLLCIHETNDYDLSLRTKMSIILDVASALEELHSAGWVHGRLKTSNIILYPGDRAKLSDYGVVDYLTMEARIKFRGKNGLRHLAPEVVKQESACLNNEHKAVGEVDNADTTLYPTMQPSADVYSFGMVLTCIIKMQSMPFKNVSEESGVYHCLMRGEHPRFPNVLPQETYFNKIHEVSTRCILCG
jgi:serine/threonine protein kinase